jgi:hypothetical protein
VWLQDKLNRLAFVQKHAASRRLLVTAVKEFLNERGSLPKELEIDPDLSHALGEECTHAYAMPEPDFDDGGSTFYRQNSVGVFVAFSTSLANEGCSEAIVDSLTIVSALWKQLEGAHRDMLENHWTTYSGVLSFHASNLVDGDISSITIQADQGEQNLFVLDDGVFVVSEESGDETNRVSITKKRNNRQKSGAKSMDDSKLLDEPYDHARKKIDGMVRRSHSEGSLPELDASSSSWSSGGFDRIYEEAKLDNPAGKYDGDDVKQLQFHNVIPPVLLQSEESRVDLLDSSNSAFLDHEVVIVQEEGSVPVAVGHHLKKAVDVGWGERETKFGGSIVGRTNNNSVRDDSRFEAYMGQAVDEATHWNSNRSVNAPVIFPDYDTSKVLAEDSIEAYRWFICGLAGFPTSQDDPNISAKDQMTYAGSSPPENLDSSGHSLSSLALHQQPLYSLHTPITRREQMQQPLHVFEDHEFGSIAAELLLRFLQRFSHRADKIVCEFARKRMKYCSLSLVCCRIAQIVLWVLRLVPSSKPSYQSYEMRSSTSNNNISELNSFFKNPPPVSSMDQSEPFLLDHTGKGNYSANCGNDSSGVPKEWRSTPGVEAISDKKKCKNVASLASDSAFYSASILPPKMLALEPSWALLSSEKCVQEAFDVALLMFDDIWKYVESTEACGIHYDTVEGPVYVNTSATLQNLAQQNYSDAFPSLHFDPFNFCLDVVKSLMSELIDMKLVYVDQLWHQWTLLRTRQEVVFESKLIIELLRLNLLHHPVDSTNDMPKLPAVDGADQNLSVRDSLSRRLRALGAKKADVPRAASNSRLNSLRRDQTQHEQYARMVGLGKDSPPTPPFRIYGESQILTTGKFKQLRHVMFISVCNACYLSHIIDLNLVYTLLS